MKVKLNFQMGWGWGRGGLKPEKPVHLGRGEGRGLDIFWTNRVEGIGGHVQLLD